MIIFKDAVTGDELFSDAFPYAYEDEGFIITVKGKVEIRKGTEIDESAIGGNASQEEQSEAIEGPGVLTGIDIALNHRLEDITSFLPEKKDVQKYLKRYVKNLADKLVEEDTEKCKKFKANCAPEKGKLANFMKKWTKETTIYKGEHSDAFTDAKASLMFGNWNEDGMSLTFYCLADGILEEKQ